MPPPIWVGRAEVGHAVVVAEAVPAERVAATAARAAASVMVIRIGLVSPYS
jgi:hypothetical protein